MSDCCTSPQPSNQGVKRRACPRNGRLYVEVPYTTVLHHVDKPWLLDLKEQQYYFCDDPECDVVYFGGDNTLITKATLRTMVGSKETTDYALICYCFGVNRHQAQSDPKAKAFVIEQTRRGTCSCEVSNPSGRCCLKDFPK